MMFPAADLKSICWLTDIQRPERPGHVEQAWEAKLELTPQPGGFLMAKEPKKLDELFHDTLKDIYYAEKKILTALPKMAKAAQNEQLKAAFEKHEGETESQIER